MGEFLAHYGVKGMKWGVRKDRNNSTLFVSGSSKTQFKDSGYYRRQLPKPIKKRLNEAMRKKVNIVVGDAPGVDRQVQNYLNKSGYSRVTIYGPGTKVRYTANKSWTTKPIDAPEFEVGSKEWLAKKDIEMEKIATEGLAITLDEGSKATKKNVERLLANNKKVTVYELSKYGKKKDRFL